MLNIFASEPEWGFHKTMRLTTRKYSELYDGYWSSLIDIRIKKSVTFRIPLLILPF